MGQSARGRFGLVLAVLVSGQQGISPVYLQPIALGTAEIGPNFIEIVFSDSGPGFLLKRVAVPKPLLPQSDFGVGF